MQQNPVYTVDGIHGLCIWPAGCTERQCQTSRYVKWWN